MRKDFRLTHSQNLLTTPEYVASYVTYTSQDRNKTRFNVEIIEANPVVSVVVLNEHNEVAIVPVFNPATGKWFYEVPFRSFNIKDHVLQVAEEVVAHDTGLHLRDAILLTQAQNHLDPKSSANFHVVFGRVQTLFDESNEDVKWVNIKEAYYRLKTQLKYDKPFMEDMYLGGTSSDALLIYKFVEE